METLGGRDLPLHSTDRLYQCPVHSEQEPLAAVPGNIHEPILQIWNRVRETLERRPCRTQPWPPQTATALCWPGLERLGEAESPWEKASTGCEPLTFTSFSTSPSSPSRMTRLIMSAKSAAF